MASLNTPRKPKLPPQGGTAPQAFEPSNTLRTHEGGPAASISVEQALRRSVCSCLLWESEFYEDGQAIADRINNLARHVPAETLADLAWDARTHMHLRHAPLLLCAILAQTGKGSRLVSDTITGVIQRADELSEFVSVYAKINGVPPNAVKKKMSAQVKKGLAKAFTKFDSYQLAKYFSASGEKGAAVRGRDVMFMTHPRSLDEKHNELFRKIAKKEAIEEGGADTWEVALSKGADKKETFTRLLSEGRLGYLALLRNLRNMAQAGVDETLVRDAILARRGAHRVFPFRYVAAARACPQFEPFLDQALSEAISDLPVLDGKTAVLVDVSGSMDTKLSGKSDLSRMDAAAALASVINGDVRVFTFSDTIMEVPARRGMAGIQTVINSQPHNGTYLGLAVAALDGQPLYRADERPMFYYGRRPTVQVPALQGPLDFDRLIVITDEQSHDHVAAPKFKRNYMINVASNKNGVGYGEGWTHLDGFSEQVIRWIAEFESL